MPLRFLTRNEIAQLAGVSLTAIKKGYRNLPPPDVIVGRTQGWSRETIDTWLKDRHQQEKHPQPQQPGV